MTEEARLRKFITKRFITTLVIVAVAEFFISTFISRLIIPHAIPALIPQLGDLSDLSAGTIGFIVFMIIVRILASLIGEVVPPAGPALIRFVNSHMGSLGFVDSDNVIANLPTGSKIVLVFFLIASAIVMLLPIVAGSWFFSAAVSREFRKLDEIRAAEQKTYDRKRYLMISDIAHDLKTPMTTVAGYARALSEGMIAVDKQQEYLDTITAKTERMNDIVQMLFNYARLDSDGFELVMSDVDICELLRECVASAYTDIEEAGDEIDVDIPESVIKCKIDKVQLSRSINNLLVNAVKHNANGTKIYVGLKDEYDTVRIFVADSGEAIAQELAEKLFEPFVMGDESRSSKGGSGLGLSVSKKICELHQGRIKLVQNNDMTRYQLDKIYKKVFVISLPVESA